MIKKIKVNKVDIDTRIDRWIRRRINNLTQSFIERNLRKGLIKVNNYKIKSSYKLKHNDIIIIELVLINILKSIVLGIKRLADTMLIIKTIT